MTVAAIAVRQRGMRPQGAETDVLFDDVLGVILGVTMKGHAMTAKYTIFLDPLKFRAADTMGMMMAHMLQGLSRGACHCVVLPMGPWRTRL